MAGPAGKIAEPGLEDLGSVKDGLRGEAEVGLKCSGQGLHL